MSGKEYLRHCKLKQYIANVCSGRVAEVTLFDMHSIIVELLCNEDLIKREKNLVLRDNNVTYLHATVVGYTNIYDDVNSVIWRKETTKKMKQDHPDIEQYCSVFRPLILFINGVYLSWGEFTNLNQELGTYVVRNKAHAWRPIAYVDYEGNMKGKVTPIMALNKYHEVEIQGTGMNWTFTLLPNEESEDVALFFPVQFIIGACNGYHKLCGHFKSHNNMPGLV